MGYTRHVPLDTLDNVGLNGWEHGRLLQVNSKATVRVQPVESISHSHGDPEMRAEVSSVPNHAGGGGGMAGMQQKGRDRRGGPRSG